LDVDECIWENILNKRNIKIYQYIAVKKLNKIKNIKYKINKKLIKNI